MSARERGRPFLVAAPSGTGKTTVCREVMRRDPRLRFSISHTTRAPRAGEVDGEHYHFVDVATFRRMVDAGAFLEHAEYANNLYGTSWASLETPLAQGYDLLLEIEVQGARQVRRKQGRHGLDVCFIFLLPPSRAELERRLRARGTDSEDAIGKRLAVADVELEAAEIFDYAVVNDALATAVEDVLAIVGAVREGRAAAIADRFGRERVVERWRRTAEEGALGV